MKKLLEQLKEPSTPDEATAKIEAYSKEAKEKASSEDTAVRRAYYQGQHQAYTLVLTILG